MAISPFSPAIFVLFMSLLVPEQQKFPSPPPAEMYRYVLAQADFALNLRVQDLAHQFPQRLKKLEEQPLLQVFPPRRRRYAFRRFLRKIQRIAKQIKSKTGKDLFKDVRYITLSMKMNPEEGLANLGIQLTPTEFQKLGKQNRWKIEKRQDFHVAYKSKKSGDGWLLAPNGSLLTLSRRALQRFLKEGASSVTHKTITQKLKKTHRPKVMLSLVLSQTETIKKLLRRAMKLKQVSTLLHSWDTFSIQIGLQHVHFEIHTQTENVAKRTKQLFFGIKHLIYAASLSGSGLMNMLQGLLNVKNQKGFGKRTKMLLKHKAQLFTLMKGYLGNTLPQVNIQQNGQTTSMDVETPLNRIWLLFVLLAAA
ncbi:MAG: hypothetical protein AAGJ35_07610 [Myxococcota bacterium]